MKSIALLTQIIKTRSIIKIQTKKAKYHSQMRYIMKGGVWKNSQDEILKAAIMKYGMNQWSRISSLLQRKSAKQCKQRWYEWLDPSIKKTEWTRAQDQKLLQLARVFPSQWRTIAPFVGRTPSQCYDRYEKLLDMAQGKSIKETEDLKKLRPGEIDPNPETKPARLDAIDMDEDEKEMLAEVRVRLANTKGKKAKRKEREKIIEQARRLAQLQKIRELEMAGVDNIPTAKEIKRMKQNKSIDYNKEIPFERQIPEFKYSHQDEQQKAPSGTSYANTISLQTLEGKRRDVQEELQRKLDKRRMKKLKERDLKTVMAMKDKFQKPASFPIELPQPQITEKDLQDMKRYNITTPMNSQLLSKSGQTPMGMTPHNKLLFSARVNMSLNHENLFAKEYDDEGRQYEDEDEGHIDGIEGLNYLKKLEQDKKLGLNQPLRSIDRVISEKRMKTPLLNEWEEGSGVSSSKIKSLFSKMSKPQNQVEFEIPEEQEQQQEEEQHIMDAQEAEKLERKRLLEEEEKRKQQQSSALKKNLPRFKLIPEKISFHTESETLKLIQQQMASLIYSDAVDYPVAGSVFPQNAPQYKGLIFMDSLNQAKKLVEEQIQSMRQSSEQIDTEIVDLIRKKVKLDFKKQSSTLLKQELSEKSELQQMNHQFLAKIESIKTAMKSVDSNAKKNKKLLGGYEKLIRTKTDQINQLNIQLDKTIRQRQVLEEIRKVERQAINRRFEEINSYCKEIYKVV